MSLSHLFHRKKIFESRHKASFYCPHTHAHIYTDSRKEKYRMTTYFVYVGLLCIFFCNRKTKTKTYIYEEQKRDKKFTTIFKRQLRAAAVEKETSTTTREEKKDKYTVHVGGEY